MGDERILKELILAYAMELETVQNYIAGSVNPDGVRSDVIERPWLRTSQPKLIALTPSAAPCPVRLTCQGGQKSLQPPPQCTDVVTLIKGIIDAEESAIAQYNKIIKLCEGTNYVTQDLVIEILGGEEETAANSSAFSKSTKNRAPEGALREIMP